MSNMGGVMKSMRVCANIVIS